MQRNLLFLGVCSLLIGAGACSSSSSPTGSSSGTSGSSSGTSGSSGDAGTGDPRTFSGGVAPILAKNCSLAACHGSSASNLGVYIPYDPKVAYTELMKTSATAKIPFVTPGDPTKSYLQIKIDGTQDSLSAQCGGSCGAQMPLGLDPLTQAQRDIVKAWIVAGAKDD